MLKTEQRNPKSANIDKASTREMLSIMQDENENAMKAVRSALGSIEKAVDVAAEKIKAGGRIIYVGAAGIFALALAITLTVLLLTSGRGESAGPTVRGGAPTGPDEDRLVEMQPKPVLKSHILPVPKR